MAFDDRLKVLIDTLYDGNTSKFARSLNTTEGRVRSYFKGTKPSIDFVSEILRTHNDISFRWLMWGDGEMLIQPQVSVTSASNSQVAIGKNINQQKDVVESSTADVEMLKAKIASLERELQQKDETIRAKDETLQLYKQLLGKN